MFVSQPLAIDQGRYAGDPAFSGGVEDGGLAFRSLGTFTFTSTTLQVALSNIADGNVIAGPVLIERVSDGVRRRVQSDRDPDSLALLPSSEYSDSPADWTDLVYPTGGGNNPLWESVVLRSAFRALFDDYQNGALSFPDLGDAPSPDPNSTPIAKNQLPSLATPFSVVMADGEAQVGIPAALRQGILDGLAKLVSLIDLGSNSSGSDLPLVGKATDEIASLGGMLREKLVTPVSDYFGSLPIPHLSGLLDTVRDLMPGRPAAGGGFEFGLDLRDSYNLAGEPLELIAKAGGPGLDFDGTVDVSASVGFVDAVDGNLPRFTFGVDLSPGGGLAMADRVYVEADRALLTIDIHATDVDLGGTVAFVDAGVVGGTLDLDLDLTLNFVDPDGSGRITLSELEGGLSDPGSLLDVSLVGSSVSTLPLSVPLLGITPGPDSTVTVVYADLNDPAGVTVDFPANAGMDQLLNFENLDFADIVALLRRLHEFLVDIEGFSFLDEALPLLNKSPGELLDFADRFLVVIQEFEANPASSLAEAEERLELALGLPVGSPLVSFAASGDDLLIDFSFDAGFSGMENLDLDLSSLLALVAGGAPGFSGLDNIVSASGNLAVDANVQFDFDLGIDLSDPASPTPFLRDTTGLTLDLFVDGAALDFRAAVGPVGLFVDNGTVRIDADGDRATSAPATLTLGILDDPVDGRYLLGELGTAILEAPVLIAGANATLPLFFPTEAVPLGGAAPDNQLVVDIPNLSDVFDGVAGSVSLSGPDLSAAALGNLSAFTQGGIAAILAGLQSLVAWAESLDGFGFLAEPLPLVNRPLGELLDFGGTVLEAIEGPIS
ncbi:MAG: hypothetical protein ACC661_07630, partial [Verrucomicrobiales bacterium]